MSQWLSLHRAALALAFRRLWATPLNTLLSLLVIGIALTLPAFGYVALDNLRILGNSASGVQQISLFMSLDAGKIRLLAASQFKIERTYTGVLPYWPGIKEGPGATEVNDLLNKDFRTRRQLIPGQENKDNWRTSAYWQGKGLTRATQLARWWQSWGRAAVARPRCCA